MWYLITGILFLWLVYDLINGHVWSYYKIKRVEEPIKYWFFMIVWTMIALLSLFMTVYN